MEEYDKGPVTSCFAHISNHSDGVFNHAVKVVFFVLDFSPDFFRNVKGRFSPLGGKNPVRAKRDWD